MAQSTAESSIEPIVPTQRPAAITKLEEKEYTAVKERTDALFIRDLVDAVSAGYRLVPFVGSGCSAQSGILMGQQFSGYLAWTVAACVADRREWSKYPAPRWNLRKKGWPPQPTPDQLEQAKDWVRAEFRHLARKHGMSLSEAGRMTAKSDESSPTRTYDELVNLLYAPIVPAVLRGAGTAACRLTNGEIQRELHAVLTDSGLTLGGLMRRGVSMASEDAIFERAIRSLHDWRATLQFLSELKVAPDGHTLLLDKPDQTVVDGFNVHITRGRRPNLAHTMLCHLRQPARMRLILTTNFDTLIEDAFAEQERRIDVISVGIKGSLPDPEIVHSRDTVVKIHGTVSDTRADFSLDEVPGIEDRKRFFHYVRGGNPDSPDDRFLPGHLLVAGYSGNDARCVQLMKAALDDPEARVFWVCHTHSDLEALKKLFGERAYRDRIIATVHERVDLLLYEFHQQLCLHLPPGSLSEHINHNVPPESLETPSKAGEAQPEAPSSREQVRFSNAINNAEQLHAAMSAPESVTIVDGDFGILGTTRENVRKVANEHGLTEIWFELEDYGSAESLAHDLFQQIASRRGVFHSSHELCPRLLFQPLDDRREWLDRWRDHLELIRSHVGIDPQHWIVVLYGRNGPGGCCGWSETEFWGRQQYRIFEIFLLALKEAKFRVVYAPYSRTRLVRDQRHKRTLIAALQDSKVSADVATRVANDHLQFSPVTHCVRYLKSEGCRSIRLRPCDEGNNPNGDFGATVNEVIRIVKHGFDAAGADGASARRVRDPRILHNLLYGASLFRQSRHYTSFLGEGVMRSARESNHDGFDNDLERHRELQFCLNKLYSDPPVFLRKPGGFVWAYRNVRLALRCVIDALSSPPQPSVSFAPGARSEPLPARGFRARAHFDIGIWYRRAYYVSGHANPLMEAAYHFWQCMQHAPEAHGSHSGEEEATHHRLKWWQMGLRELVKALRSAEAPLRYWCGRGELEIWFGHGQVDDGRTAVSQWLPQQAEQIAGVLLNGDLGKLSRSDRRLLHLLSVELHQLGNRLHDRQRTYAALSLGGLTYPRPAVDADEFLGQLVFAPEPPTDHLDLWESSAEWWTSPAVQKRSKLTLPDWLHGLLERAYRAAKEARGGHASVVVTPEELRRLVDDPAAAIEAFQQLVVWTFLLGSRAKRLEHAAPFEEAVEEFKTGTPHAINLDCSRPVPFLLRRICTPREVRRSWLMASFFASATLQAAYWLLPGHEEFVSQQLSKTYAMYGLALARLHRFYEAHGKFNQAQALLAESRRDHLVNLGLIDLRRAEAYLLEALLASEVVTALATAGRDWAAERGRRQQLNALKSVLWPSLQGYLDADEEQSRKEAVWLWLEPQLEAVLASAGGAKTTYYTLLEGLWRIVVARGDDAWGCLERAENLLSGRTHSSLWWSRLRALQLHVLAVDDSPILPSLRGHRALSERVLHERAAFALRLWNDGRVAAPQDRFNRLRLLDYYVRATHVILVVERRVLALAERRAIVDELVWLGMFDEDGAYPGKVESELEGNYQTNVAWRVRRVLEFQAGRGLEKLNYANRSNWREIIAAQKGFEC